MRHLSPHVRAALFKAASGPNWVGRIQAISAHAECVPILADDVKYLLEFFMPVPAMTSTGEIDWRFRDNDGDFFLPKLEHRILTVWAVHDDLAQGMSEIFNVSEGQFLQAPSDNFGRMLNRAFKTYCYSNTTVEQYFIETESRFAEYLKGAVVHANSSAEADVEVSMIQQLAAPHYGFEIHKNQRVQPAEAYRVSAFSVHLDVAAIGTNAHLFANGNQQVTIRIDIRKQRENSDGSVENSNLTYAEIASLRLREVGAPIGSPLPPGWAVSRTRNNRFDQGVGRGLALHQEKEYPQPMEAGFAYPAEEDTEVFYLYVTTTEVNARDFVAEATITGLGTISTTDEIWGRQPTGVLIRSTPPRILQLSDFDTYHEELINEKINGQPDTWWWLRMTHFRLKPESVQRESLDISNVPYYGTASYRTFARGETLIAGVVNANTTSIITTLIRQGYVSYPSANSRYFLFPATDISAFTYTDTDFNVAHFRMTSSLKLTDKVGTLSTFYIQLGADNVPILSTSA